MSRARSASRAVGWCGSGGAGTSIPGVPASGFMVLLVVAGGVSCPYYPIRLSDPILVGEALWPNETTTIRLEIVRGIAVGTGATMAIVREAGGTKAMTTSTTARGAAGGRVRSRPT